VRLILSSLGARASDIYLTWEQVRNYAILHRALTSFVRVHKTTVSIDIWVQQQFSSFLNKTLDYRTFNSVRVTFVRGMRIESRSNCALSARWSGFFYLAGNRLRVSGELQGVTENSYEPATGY
jgi:hypothetical protein